ncbi:MAG: hypothetical protein BMS9Abin36_2100 [Gammaproteobacteria bacterium]|nr:MAG: hypothetical protein BMS9Abin36_2100 [Gammaproteobacteria bacterium]
MTQVDITNSHAMEAIDAQTFRKKFRLLIFIAWSVPAIFGLSFILYVQILSVPEMAAVMTHPLEPLFMAFWFIFSLWYFMRFARPIVTYLENSCDESIPAARDCVRRFPFHFWLLFLLYLVMAPVSVIWAAELYAGFVSQPVDWFRINMVALIVSIIVGLPIFFLILDLFGRALSGVQMGKPHITVKTKVFLIGALVPLLIDTMLVQYYWSRTGFFTTETFIVWLFLELLAIGGSLIFVRSFGQSLAPLEAVFDGHQPLLGLELNALKSQSTDEIGVLATAYRNLLSTLQMQSEMLELNNWLLRKTGHSMSLESVANSVISIADRTMEGDMCFLLLHDAEQDELVGVAQTGAKFNAGGHFRVAMDEPSLAIMTFKQDQVFAIADVQTYPSCSPELRQRFKIQSALSAPLRLEGKPIGVLMSTSMKIRRDYSARDEAVIQDLAREAALAINTQRLNDQALQAQVTQHEKDELIELLMDSTEEAIYGVDFDGNCTFVNRACVEMLGYDNESELLGQGIHALIHHSWPDGSPHPRAECAVHIATLEQSSAHGDDEVYWRKDGSSFPIEYWSHPIRKEGEIVGTVVTFLDITERINTRKELVQSSERLGLAIDAGDIGVWEWDIATDRLDWSEKMEEIFGMQASEFKGEAQDFYDRVYPADMEMLAKDTSDALEKNTPFSVVYRIVKPDKSIGWVHCQANVKRDASGKSVGMIGVLTDITAQKEADQVVYRLKSTLDMTTDCVFMFDPETLKFNYVNLGAINQVGYSEQEMLDMSPVDIKPEFDEQAFRQMIQPMLDGELKQHQFETIHRRKNGDLIPVEISLSYVQPANEPARFVAIVHDITARKRAEGELREHRDHLEEMVDARTNELQVVNKELEAFAYSVSHDLRTPLRSIDGFSLALLEDYRDKLDKDGRDYLSRIRGGAQKMAELIDDLLELSRVTRSRLKCEAIDLSAMTSEVLNELAAREPKRQVDTRIAEGIIVRGDRRLLKVVMDNLLGNAWKYTGKKEKPEIEFGVMEKNGEIVYYVRDNGAGFDMKYADKLFGAFQRLHTSKEFSGTGVGLATVQRIVHRHGGRTWAEAEQDSGATIYFSLGVNGGGDNGQQENTTGGGQPRRRGFNIAGVEEK